MDIEKLQAELREFAKERDWEQFHTPKNLMMAMTGEVGELLEIFQWLSDSKSLSLDSDTKKATAEELADIFIYLVRLSDILEIDLEQSVKDKLELNGQKYPVHLSKGNAKKYNKRSD